MTLRTAYLYDINDKVNDDIKSTKNKIDGLSFRCLRRMQERTRETSRYIS